MSLLDKLDEDLKKAMKASDRLRLSALRLVKAAVKNQQIEKRQPLSDEDIFSVISTLAKQRKESIEQFSKAGREDMAEQERQELQILQSYMPQQLSDEAVEALILQAIQEASASSEADMGRVMKILMPRIKGVADGKQVSSRVKELLHSSTH